jgi:hypothetical protein
MTQPRCRSRPIRRLNRVQRTHGHDPGSHHRVTGPRDEIHVDKELREEAAESFTVPFMV